jgi:hypothetical protein
MIYEVKNERTGATEYVISSHHSWLEGVYASRRAANYAFRFTDDEISEIWKRHCPDALTFEQLREFRKEKKR